MKKLNRGIIYRWYRIATMESYIGQTTNPTKRFKDYERLDKRVSPYLLHTMQKYGIDRFRLEILEKDVNPDHLSKLEILHIRFFDSFHNGYNLTEGGEGKRGWQPSDETRERMRSANIGKTLSLEHREKIRQTLKKRWKNKIAESPELHQQWVEQGKKYAQESMESIGLISEESLERMRKGGRKGGKRGGKKRPSTKTRQRMCVSQRKRRGREKQESI